VAPRHLKRHGRAFYTLVSERYELGVDHEEALLRTAEIIDEIEECRKRLKEDSGVIITDRYGGPKVHPAAELELKLRAQLKSFLDSLKLDEEDATAVSTSAAQLARKRWRSA